MLTGFPTCILSPPFYAAEVTAQRKTELAVHVRVYGDVRGVMGGGKLAEGFLRKNWRGFLRQQ